MRKIGEMRINREKPKYKQRKCAFQSTNINTSKYKNLEVSIVHDIEHTWGNGGAIPGISDLIIVCEIFGIDAADSKSGKCLQFPLNKR